MFKRVAEYTAWGNVNGQQGKLVTFSDGIRSGAANRPSVILRRYTSSFTRHYLDSVVIAFISRSRVLYRIFPRNQFHVCLFGLPPDIMHDILEGYLLYTMKLMLNAFISSHYFSLSQLNQIIQSFHYGHCDSANKPSLLSEVSMANV